MNSGTAADFFRRGIEAAKLGFPDKAAAEFEEAAHIEPDNAEVQFNLGTAYLSMGDFEQAIVNLSKAVELKPACQTPGGIWQWRTRRSGKMNGHNAPPPKQ